MNLTKQMAQQVREFHFNGSRVGGDLKKAVEGLTWQQANTQIASLNTIAKLVFHINYYVAAVLKVLEGGPLDAHDKFSFDMSPIESQADWDALLEKVWADAEKMAALVEQLPEEQLWKAFEKEKYGNYHRNIQGIVEHSYYHIGQIALIKKMILEKG